MMNLLRTLAAIALLAAAPCAGATQWFVATNGNDANTGTVITSPFATFAKAVSKVAAGDLVNIACGSYTQAFADSTKSGTPLAPIVFRAAAPGCATISNVSIGILLSSVSYVTIDGLSVSGIRAVDFANTNAAIGCTAASFAAGGAPNVNTWAEIENSNHVTIQNGKFQFAIGYPGIGITGYFLASGQSYLTNQAALLVGTTRFVSVLNNTLDHLGNLLDRTATCGDSINIRNGTMDHILISGNTITHSAHNSLQTTDANNVIVQNNLFDNSWQDLFPAAIFNGITRTGYRLMDSAGLNNLYQGNLFEHAGCCNQAASFLAPIMELLGTQNLVRRNVFWDSTTVFIDLGCGVLSTTNVVHNHLFHNTMVGADASAFSFQAFSPCVTAGNHVFVNNLLVNTRQDISHLAGIAAVDADAQFILQGPPPNRVNVNLGPIGQNFFSNNLWAPSLTSPNVVSTRPLMFNQGSNNVSLATELSLFPAFVLPNNIDAGATPSKRPTFIAPIPATNQRAVYGNFALASGSPGIDQGSCLTTTSAAGTNTTSIPVVDAYYFTDGMGLIPGDTIQLCGTTKITTITAITYGTYPAGTLTVSPAVSFANNTGITLPFAGASPDIGAFEFSSAAPAVTNKNWNGTSCISNGRKYTDPSHCPP